jgi:hypothetical protein
MHIIAQHKISDPAKFWEAAKAKTANLPHGLKLHKVLPNAEGTHAVCLWEAKQVADVSAFVEGAVGHISKNEYFEVDATKAMGLP